MSEKSHFFQTAFFPAKNSFLTKNFNVKLVSNTNRNKSLLYIPVKHKTNLA